MFLSLDGVDGGGKSTQLALLVDWLRARRLDVVACRDPGSTQLGEALRRIVLQGHDTPIHRIAEMLIYMAARAQLVEEVIRPALGKGQTVVCDRFLLANVVYQGHAGGLDVERIWSISDMATGGLYPDLTIVLDLDVATATRRLGRAQDRMEAQGSAFLERVREGYLIESRRHRERIAVVSAAGDVEAVQQAIRAVVEARRIGAARETP